tara:strand:+ start:1185 stop:1919 length:735 start_codon:yes stop_codon:yes gene_type:complete
MKQVRTVNEGGNIMPNKKNLDLWKKVEKTDPKHTRKVQTRGGFTAIDAQYQLKVATEEFGPFGQGWGVKDENIEKWEEVGLVLYQATLWYTNGSLKGEFPINASIQYKVGDRLDSDFAKKVTTDALTKGLSKLGFNADVFLGMFDDNKYVAEMQKQFGDGISDKQSKAFEALLKKMVGEGMAPIEATKWKNALKQNKITTSNYDSAVESLKAKHAEMLKTIKPEKENENGDDSGVVRTDSENEQ